MYPNFPRQGFPRVRKSPKKSAGPYSRETFLRHRPPKDLPMAMGLGILDGFLCVSEEVLLFLSL